jgi:hypothetical protein
MQPIIFSLVTPVSSTNTTDRHDIIEILLKVALNSINQAKPIIFLETTLSFINKLSGMFHGSMVLCKAFVFQSKVQDGHC